MEALETILAKGAASSVVPRKRGHVLLDDVALDREDIVVAQAIGDAKVRAREVELVQLDGRKHFRGACVVAHNRKLLQNEKMPDRKFRSRPPGPASSAMMGPWLKRNFRTSGPTSVAFQ